MKNTQLLAKLNKISELQNILSDNLKINDALAVVIKKFSIKRINTFFDSFKTKGFIGFEVLLSLILTRLLNVTVFGFVLSQRKGLAQMQKDTFYRLKNNSLIDWRKLHYYFITRYLQLTKTNNSDTKNRLTCFIFDDTLLSKTGRKMEFIGKVYDHVCHKMQLGFKLLTLGYWDGEVVNVVDFSLHSEAGKKGNYGLSKKELSKRFGKERDKNTPAYKRIKELDKKKTNVAVSMLRRAVKHGICAKYLLMDSWFLSDEILQSVFKIKKCALHIIGACKMDKRKYDYNGKSLTAKELLASCKKQSKRCRKLKSRYIDLRVSYKGKEVRLFFSKYSRRDRWNLILSTDVGLNYLRAIEIYQIRWGIEVFYKESKQYLKLSGSQSTDFDAQIADITISIITYMLLNYYKKQRYKTIGQIYRCQQKELTEANLWEKILQILLELVKVFVDVFGINLDETMSKIVKSEDEKIYNILRLLKQDGVFKKVA